MTQPDGPTITTAEIIDAFADLLEDRYRKQDRLLQLCDQAAANGYQVLSIHAIRCILADDCEGCAG